MTAAGAATAALAPALTACGAETPGGDTKLKLVAADYGDNAANSSKKYWSSLAKAFESKNKGIKVDVQVYSWTEVDKKVADMVAAGKAPDLAQIGAYADFAAAGKLYSADQLLSIPTQADFISGIARAGEVHRVQYGLPFVSSTRLLFYNKKLFAKAGVAKAPESWDELQAAAVKLKAAGVQIPFGLPLGPEEAPAEMMMWILSAGGGYTDKNSTYTIDSEANVKAFKWLRDELVGKGLVGPGDPARTNRQDVFDAFTRGEVGMLNGHPTLMQQAKAKRIDFDTAPLPGYAGKAKATMGVADWMMAFRQNGHREQIGKFLDFVYSKDNVLSFCTDYRLLPVTTAASEAMRAERANADLWPFLGQLTNAEFYPADKTSWAKVSKTVKEKIGMAVRPGGDPESILSEIQREATATENTGR
ncbi:ABC transporter substrate-binding protein [Streptomyces cinnamoneus]|uniref:ABC transporter substrate-binding protein n=1 Tax=Streptomyces cinnamoneus TaxID=53446 RepID=A0A2G1XCA6_STRCJ|nr:extracellular solute-binding protein [Streptomyces cinnamoneus]PHQ48894.1 ABC transporter substrate-binding protein [Streptomyces cinnamoneus]PPT14458.1 ABC transporter substrate-binding protein [Streptomyces cinnamoneus]